MTSPSASSTPARVPVPARFFTKSAFSTPLWAQRSEAWLRQQYASDRWSFQRGYRQYAPRDEDRVFNYTSLLRYGVRVRDLVTQGAFRFAGFDPGGDTRPGNALVSVAILPTTGLRVIEEMQLWRGISESAGKILASFERHRWSVLVVENAALQGYAIELLKAKCPYLPIAPFLPTRQSKARIEFGQSGLVTDLLNSLWALCMDDPYDTDAPLFEHPPDCGCAYHEFLRDLDNFPSPGRAYDLLMAWWFAREAGGQALDLIAGHPPTGEASEAMERLPEGAIPADEISGFFIR